jgi:hypothetical protein
MDILLGSWGLLLGLPAANSMEGQRFMFLRHLMATSVMICMSCCSHHGTHRGEAPINATTQTTKSADGDEGKLIQSDDQNRQKASSQEFLSEPNLSEAQKIVGRIVDGKLLPNAEGVVVLPRESQSLSLDGKVFVTIVNDKPIAILFIKWMGRVSNLKGYLFCAGSSDVLAPRQNYDDDWTIEIVIPRPDSPPNDTGRGRVLYSASKVAHWYCVVRSED